MSGPAAPITTVIFDLGGVVLRWDPRLAYRMVIPEDEIDDFLSQISFQDWNRRHDAGLPWSEGERELITRFPERAEAVRAYRQHFDLAIPGMVPGTNAVIAELQDAGVGLVALTNWAADTFAQTRRRFHLLDRFEDIVVSGAERLAKPDPAIFTLLLHRHGLDPARTLFVDDSAVNCAAAEALGIRSVLFEHAAALRARLVGFGLLGEPPALGVEVHHLVERVVWEEALTAGRYPWSTRGLGYESAGFVHAAFAGQLADVRARYFADVAAEELLAVRVPAGTAPVILEPVIREPVTEPGTVESGATGGPAEGYPHLFAPLDPAVFSASRLS